MELSRELDGRANLENQHPGSVGARIRAEETADPGHAARSTPPHRTGKWKIQRPAELFPDYPASDQGRRAIDQASPGAQVEFRATRGAPPAVQGAGGHHAQGRRGPREIEGVSPDARIDVRARPRLERGAGNDLRGPYPVDSIRDLAPGGHQAKATAG